VNGGGGGGGGRIYVKAPTRMSFTGIYNVSGGSSTAAQAGGSGFAYSDTNINNLPYRRVYTDNTYATGKDNKIAKSYFPEPVQSTPYDFQDVYVGAKSIFYINGNKIEVEVRTLGCDKTGLIEIPDYAIFTADKGKTESVVACSFNLAQEGELRMPPTVTLSGSNTIYGRYYIFRVRKIL
jgi:hypothetical protein